LRPSIDLSNSPARRIARARIRIAAERDENTGRKDFTPSEAVAVGRRLEEMAQERTKYNRSEAARRRWAKRKGVEVGHLPTSTSQGHVRDRVALAMGIGGTTYYKAKKVVEAAESGDPVAIEARGEMGDRTGLRLRKLPHVRR
jgi:hypothetical protein